MPFATVLDANSLNPGVAVASDAQAIVTFNLKDFPPEACEPFPIEAIHPDEFLLDRLTVTVPRFTAALR